MPATENCGSYFGEEKSLTSFLFDVFNNKFLSCRGQLFGIAYPYQYKRPLIDSSFRISVGHKVYLWSIHNFLWVRSFANTTVLFIFINKLVIF